MTEPQARDERADILDTPEAGPAIIRGGSLRVAAYAASILISVASAAVLTRYLGVSAYGQYAAVFSVVMIVSSFSEAGMTNAAVREYATREGDDRTRLMASLLGLRLVIASVGVLAIVGFTLGAGYGGEVTLGAALAGAGVVVAIFSGTLAVGLQAKLRFGWVSLLDAGRGLLTGAGLIAMAAAGAGLAVLLAVPLPVGLVILVVTALLVRGDVPLRPRVDRESWAELLRLTIPFAVVTAVGTLYGYVSLPLLSLVSSDIETGLYGAVFRVFAVLAGIPAMLVASAFPLLARTARDDRDRLRYALQRMFEILLMLGVLMSLATFIGAPVAIAVITDPDEFGAATGVLQVQALALVSTCAVGLWGFALLSLHRTRALLVSNSLALVVTFGLTAGLAPSMGAYGAAVASVAGDGVLAIAYAFALFRFHPELRPDLRVLPRVALAAVLAVAAAAGLHLQAGYETLAATGIFLASLAMLRAIPAELVEIVSAFFRGAGRRPA